MAVEGLTQHLHLFKVSKTRMAKEDQQKLAPWLEFVVPVRPTLGIPQPTPLPLLLYPLSFQNPYADVLLGELKM